MITVVMGHRGTGKSEMMQRLRYYLSDKPVEFVDLDLEIEKKIGKSIHELFMIHGEDYFRELERQLFTEILQIPHTDMYLVVGAGFDPHHIPEGVRALWVRRKTDLEGRIFLDRPRLNPSLPPLDEYRKRAEIRETRFQERADEVYLMPEGVFENHHQAMAIEKKILTHDIHDIGGILTLKPEVLKNQFRWNLFKERYAGRGISYFELRDDFFTWEECLKIMTELPQEHFIFSFRQWREEGTLWSDEILQQILARAKSVDWAWELGTPETILKLVSSEKLILSLHNTESFSAWQAFENLVGHMKWAPEVRTFKDLQKGHHWQQAQSQKRSFLPRSPQGQWEWYRLWQKGRQKINFWREGEGSAGDQPSLWSWCMTPSQTSKWAAVLGDPVSHSFTPLEHSDYFYRKKCPVFAIRIAREDWSEALPVLRELGLTYAAVTSPHKENAGALCQHPSLKAVNTLYWSDQQQKWLGTSTDDLGFTDLMEGVGMLAPLQKEIYVWGGGGTLEMIAKALPHASFFSSRTGKLRGQEDEKLLPPPKVLIWAAPRTADTLWPPLPWKPAMVFDLNYKEDSMGREYAQGYGFNYQSGLPMFIGQAQGQRAFWNQCEEQE